MKKITIIWMILIFLFVFESLFGHDTLSYFDGSKGFVHYNNKTNNMYIARFPINNPIKLKSVALTLTGSASEKAIKLRVFSQEGGLPAPILERDIINPITFFKTNRGKEQINIKIDEVPILNGTQFFVAIEGLDSTTYLLSDLVAKRPNCIDCDKDQFMYQIMKKKENENSVKWQYGDFAFAIDCVVERIKQENVVFERELDHGITIDTTLAKANLSLFDFNGDGLIDLIVNSRVYINQGDFHFIESNDFFEYDYSSRFNFVVDVNNDGYYDILFLGNSSEVSSNQNVLLVQKPDGKFRHIEIESFCTNNINSFAFVDINFDGILDMIFTKSDVSELIDNDSCSISSDIVLVSGSHQKYDMYESNFIKDDLENFIGTKVLVYDYNKDGFEDVIINSLNTNPIFFRSTGKNFEKDNIINQNMELDLGTFSYTIEPIEDAQNGTDNLIWVTEHKRSMISEILRNTNFDSDEPINNYYHQLDFQDSFQGILVDDINNDSYLDIVTLPRSECHNPKLYHNHSGDFKFINNSGLSFGNIGTDGLLYDLNNDGKLDLITIHDTEIILMKNVSMNNGHQLKVKADIKDYNYFVNSTVDVFIKDRKFTRQLTLSSGYLTQRPLELSIGTGDATFVDSIYVNTSYKNNLKRKIYKNIDINLSNEILLDYSSFDEITKVETQLNVYPNPFSHFVNFELISQSNCTYHLQVFDFIGQVVFESHGATINEITNIRWTDESPNSMKSSGTYYYVIKTCNKEIQGKIIQIN
jgi:hypothetical protein